MEITPTSLSEVLLIRPRRHGDHRGFFSETYKASALREAGVETQFIQDNHSYSSRRGVVRGLHFQSHPKAQVKLVRVTRGAILDVAVDIRSGSPTYGRHVAVELSAETGLQIYVPAGFAHGFCTLTDETEVLYKVSAEYGPAEEGGLLWSDPALGIDWPVAPIDAIVSERDAAWPSFEAFRSPF